MTEKKKVNELLKFAEIDGEVEKIRAKLSESTDTVGKLRKLLAKSEAELEKLEKLANFASRDLKPPKWLTPKKRVPGHRGTVCSILSDTHFDEVVNPAEIGYLNAYNRDIAEQRLERFTENTIKISRQYLTGVEFDGAVIFLGGDMVSGTIHDMAETNETTAPDTALYWAEQLAATLETIVNEFGKLHVPCVVGNHGRLTRKPRTKQRARDNWDWVIYQVLAKHFRDDARVTFDITDGTDVLVQIYETRFLLTHGDQTNGGSGIGGIWPPIMRMVARKRVREHFDTVVMGHWHQLIMAPSQGLIVNGALKGLDEYAAISNFAPERPQQALWVTTPEHGVTFTAPVFVQDRAKEGW
jgi:predicted phosphodiesterase